MVFLLNKLFVQQGLVDPPTEVRKASTQVDDVVNEIRKTIQKATVP